MFPDIFSFNTDATLQDLITFANGKKRPKTIGNIPVYGGNGILAYTDKSNADNCVIIGRVGAYCGNTFLCFDKCWISDNAIQAKAVLAHHHCLSTIYYEMHHYLHVILALDSH